MSLEFLNGNHMIITHPCTKLPYLPSAIIIPAICIAFDQSHSILHWNECKMCYSKVIGYCQCVVAMRTQNARMYSTSD